MTRYRTSCCLVFLFKQNGLIGFNYLTKKAFSCTSKILALLQQLEDWAELQDIFDLLPNASEAQVNTTIQTLVEVTALVEDGSIAAEQEDDFQRSWEWGLSTSLLHFSVQDAGSYVPLKEAQEWRVQRAVHDPSPSLYLEHSCSNTRRLQGQQATDPLLEFMAKRRTLRSSQQKPIMLEALFSCLQAGLGITGFIETETGNLPLSMTPSGGARNPFEAYVYARNVQDLEPGFYHYSAFEHSLIRVNSKTSPSPSRLLGDQDWTDEMPCVLFLVAFFERTMWKYRDDNAYRVVLIEAGHIAQNIMLMATRMGMSACPTALLRHSEIRSCLDLTRITHNPVYALTISYPTEYTQTSLSGGLAKQELTLL